MEATGRAFYRLVMSPAAGKLPVTLEQAKAQLNADTDDDDDLIRSFIEGAAQRLDGYGGSLCRCLLEQTWALDLDHGFPGQGFHHAYDRIDPRDAEIVIDLPPVTAVTGISYVDPSGASQTLDPALWSFLPNGDRARVVPAAGQSWPVTAWQPRAVTVTFTSGYVSASAVPAPIRSAILIHVAHLYDNRGIVAAGRDTAVVLPGAYDDLLYNYRKVSI